MTQKRKEGSKDGRKVPPLSLFDSWMMERENLNEEKKRRRRRRRRGGEREGPASLTLRRGGWMMMEQGITG